MPVDWKAPDSFHRLLAALYASMDGECRLNYKRIADYYGDGATYDSIEGRFRIIKKEAKKLKEEVENGRPIAPPRGTKSADSTPRKPKTPRNNNVDGVLTGRISKSNQNSPSRRRTNAQVKRELMGDTSTSASSISGSDIVTPTGAEGNHQNMAIDENSFCSFDTLSPTSFQMLTAPPLPTHNHQMMHHQVYSSSGWDFDQEHAV